MSAADSWESTAAGLVRRAAGVAPSPVMAPLPDGMLAGHVGPVSLAEVESRRGQAEEFHRQWSDVLATQKQLVAEGWPGRIISHPDTRQPWQKALDASAVAAQSVVETAGAGETLSTGMQERIIERMAAAEERQRQSVAGPT